MTADGIKSLEREVIARRAALRTTALDLRDRLTPQGLRDEAFFQAHRAGLEFSGAARLRWIELGAVVAALIAAALVLAPRRRPQHVPAYGAGLRNRSSTTKTRKEIANGDINEDQASVERERQAGWRPQGQDRGEDV